LIPVRIPRPYSELSSNSELAQGILYGVLGTLPPYIEEQPVALAIIRLSLNTLVRFVKYGVSPQPAQAPEYSNFGSLKLIFFTVRRDASYLSLTLFFSR